MELLTNDIHKFMDIIKHGINVINEDNCNYCTLLKSYLEYNLIDYKEYNIKYLDPSVIDEIKKKNNIKTYPAIFINGKYIGGYSDYMNLSN